MARGWELRMVRIRAEDGHQESGWGLHLASALAPKALRDRLGLVR